MRSEQPLFFDILEDKNFRGLLRESQRRALSWNEFLDHPLPVNLSPLQTNKALESLGRCLGVHLFESFEGELLWYRKTYELTELLNKIEGYLHNDSAAMQGSFSHQAQVQRSSFLEQEIHACLTLSQTGRGKLRKTLLEKRNESWVSDLTNSYKSIEAKLSSDPQPFSIELVEQIAQELLAAAGPDHMSNALYFQAPLQLKATYRNAFQSITEYLHNPHNHDEPDYLKGVLIGSIIRSQGLFASATTLVASLVTKLIYQELNIPLLAVLPLTEPIAKWKSNDYAAFCVCDYESYQQTLRRTPADYTLHQTILAQCVIFTLDDLVRRITDIREQEHTLQRALSEDTSLNKRQRTVLLDLLQSRPSEISIRDYQAENGISYATARRDLLALEEEHYLSSHITGKTLVFTAEESHLSQK